MQRALQLARRGVGHTAPNPAVGCVVVRDGEVGTIFISFFPDGSHSHTEAPAMRRRLALGVFLADWQAETGGRGPPRPPAREPSAAMTSASNAMARLLRRSWGRATTQRQGSRTQRFLRCGPQVRFLTWSIFQLNSNSQCVYAVLWPALHCDSPGLQLCITPELPPPMSWSLPRVSTQGGGWRGRRHAYTRSLAVTLKSIGHNFPWISQQGSGRRAQRRT